MTPRHEQITPGAAEAIAAGFAANVPTLTTDRLTLRAPRIADFDDYASIVCTDRGIYVDGPYSREDGWFDFLSLSSGWMLHGHGGWTVSETTTERRLGFVALGLEPGDREVELGYLFLADAEGQGFAREAIRAVRDWGFQTLKLPAFVSYIDKRNARSIRLCQAIGAFDDTPVGWFPGDLVYRHLNPTGAQA